MPPRAATAPSSALYLTATSLSQHLFLRASSLRRPRVPRSRHKPPFIVYYRWRYLNEPICLDSVPLRETLDRPRPASGCWLDDLQIPVLYLEQGARHHRLPVPGTQYLTPNISSCLLSADHFHCLCHGDAAVIAKRFWDALYSRNRRGSAARAQRCQSSIHRDSPTGYSTRA